MANKIVNKIEISPKYKDLYNVTIERIVNLSIAKYGEKLAEDKARTLLHQIWGAYYSSRPNWDKLEITNLENILKVHSSTSERLSFADDFYSQIFAITGIPNSIIDHACGLNPLFYKNMNLSDEVSYTAYDIDLAEIIFLNDCFQKLKLNNFRAFAGDVFEQTWLEQTKKTDVVFLLKALPVIEQQFKGFGKLLLEQIKSRYIVVSYPVKSLSGKSKGMRAFYNEHFSNMLGEMHLHYEKLDFGNEIVFIIYNQ